MKLPFVSLNAATSTGEGAARDLERPTRRFTMAVSAAGSPSSVVVDLEGSLDGSFWLSLGRQNGVGLLTVGPDPYWVGGNTYSGTEMRHAHFVRYARANVVTLSGGSSPTVTALIAPIDEDL